MCVFYFFYIVKKKKERLVLPQPQVCHLESLEGRAGSALGNAHQEPRSLVTSEGKEAGGRAEVANQRLLSNRRGGISGLKHPAGGDPSQGRRRMERVCVCDGGLHKRLSLSITTIEFIPPPLSPATGCSRLVGAHTYTNQLRTWLGTQGQHERKSLFCFFFLVFFLLF